MIRLACYRYEPCPTRGDVARRDSSMPLPDCISRVSAGLGVALVPASLMDLRRPGVAYRLLLEPSPKMTVALAWRRDNHNACVAKFVATARTHVRLARTIRPRTVS
jgi:DNA-binding transcriptional LysR family regulator